MTGREIAEMAFEIKKPPRVPVTLIGGGAWAVHWAGKTFAAIKDDPNQIADVFIRFSRRFGNDLLWSGSNFVNYPIHFLGCPLKDDSSDSPALQGTVIKSLDEIGGLSVERVFRNPTMQSIVRSQEIVADSIGKETLIIPTQWGPLTLAAHILGVEPLLMATIDDPEGVTKLIRFATDLIWSLVEPLLAHEDIPGANFSDPVASGDVISPSMFRRFAAPALKDLVERVRRKGKMAMIHICGNSVPILRDILDIRPHCYSLESKVDLKVAREILGGKVCVAGNVSPTGVFSSGTPQEVIAEAKGCLAAWGDEGGYLLTLGCDFSKNVPLENLSALMSLKRGGQS